MNLKRFFRPAPSPERLLYEAIVAAARHETPYAEWGVADSVDGRFDMITLYLFLTLDRLKGGAEAFRQRLIDAFFADMDRSLREMGVGDISVGKKVRKMAEVFYGRVAAYSKALETGRADLKAAIARNVFPDGAPEASAGKLAGHALLIRAELAGQPTAGLLAGAIAFPEPQP